MDKTIITPSNMYVLNEIVKERCCLGKDDESWLWYRRMGHINFDNLVKVSKREAVREIMRSQSQQIFYASIVYKENKPRPLEIVHTDPVRPKRMKGLKDEL